jgi:hypothetical protein
MHYMLSGNNLDPRMLGSSRLAQGRNLEVARHQTENKALEILHGANEICENTRSCS